MSIASAGIHANALYNSTFKKMETEGYTVPRKRKTLLDALSEARAGLSIKKREDLLICKLVALAGNELVA